MLVMLIIFLVTIPVVDEDAFRSTLPTYRNIVTVTKPENIVIAVDYGREHLLDNNASSLPSQCASCLDEA